MKRINYTNGEIVGNCTFLQEIEDKTYRPTERKAFFLCFCGKEFIACITDIKKFDTKSCGCNSGFRTHSHSKTPEYKTWVRMRYRCFLKSDRQYKHYGARGITVCDRWLGRTGFQNFLSDVGYRPSPKHSIDRIDNDGNYEPSNCRWALPKEQTRNRRITKKVVFEGQVYPLAELADRYGLAYDFVFHRLKKGFSINQALAPPNAKNQKIRNSIM